MTENTRVQWTSLPDHVINPKGRTFLKKNRSVTKKPRAAAGCLRLGESDLESQQNGVVVMCSMILFLDDP